MSRPKKKREICNPPMFNRFKPVAKKSKSSHIVELSIDEYEAIRLADYLSYDHVTSAEHMKVSRPTFSRLIESARAKVSTMLIDGQQLVVNGGQIYFINNIIECKKCGHKHTVKMDVELEKCENCGSNDLFDHANFYGHGKCCLEKK